MNILFLAEALPFPVINRSRLRNYYLLRYLAGRHKVTLASFTDEGTRPDHLAHLGEFIPDIHTVPNPATGGKWWRSLISNRPAGMVHGQGSAMEALLARLVVEQRYDLVFAAQANMGRYARAARKAADEPYLPRLIGDIHRLPYQVAEQEAAQGGGWQQPLWRMEAQRYRRYFMDLLPQLAHTLVLTAKEKGSLLHLFPESTAATLAERVHVLPVGVDELDTDMITDFPAGPQILFLAEENSPVMRQGLDWFLGRVMPNLRPQIPGVHLTLLARRAEWFSTVVNAHTEMADAVTIHEYVSDLNPFWAQSRVFVVPLQREDGLQSGILQAWLRGVPVVSTRAGVSGLAIRPGQTNLVADDPADFSAAVVEMLTRPETATGLARNARHWVAHQYDYHTLYTDLDALLDS